MKHLITRTLMPLGLLSSFSMLLATLIWLSSSRLSRVFSRSALTRRCSWRRHSSFHTLGSDDDAPSVNDDAPNGTTGGTQSACDCDALPSLLPAEFAPSSRFRRAPTAGAGLAASGPRVWCSVSSWCSISLTFLRR
jgi:hypothetical protein